MEKFFQKMFAYRKNPEMLAPLNGRPSVSKTARAEDRERSVRPFFRGLSWNSFTVKLYIIFTIMSI